MRLRIGHESGGFRHQHETHFRGSIPGRMGQLRQVVSESWGLPSQDGLAVSTFITRSPGLVQGGGVRFGHHRREKSRLRQGFRVSKLDTVGWDRLTFDTKSEVLVHVTGEGAQEWAAQRGGRVVGEASQFTVEHATDVAGLLAAIDEAGLELVDISVRRPNLESVFLHLTGRGLRD